MTGVRSQVSSWDLSSIALAGGALADVGLAYATHGELDQDGGNCVVLPTYYTGTHDSYLPWIGPGRAFDTDKWFIVVPNLLGNGVSTICEPGTGRAWDPRTDPVVSIADNVMVQRALLDHLGVRRVRLVAGWSVGGMQAYRWAMDAPELVEAILPICATAQCWPLNALFLRGLEPFLLEGLADPPGDARALAAFGRAYASWAYCAAYLRDGHWREDGFASLDSLIEWWAADHVARDPADLLTTLRTWRTADAPEQALAQVNASAIVMPSTTDLYFALEEATIEASLLPRGELRPIDSPCGHVAGRPGHRAAVTAMVQQAAADLLDMRPTPSHHDRKQPADETT